MTALVLALHIELPLPVFALGLTSGMTYGIMAVGLVLIYRISRIINFAHGEIGAFAAAVLGLIVTQYGIPYWIAFVLALLLGAAMGSLVEVAVIRRLRNVPRLMSIIATLGAAQFLLYFELVVNSHARAGTVFPEPAGIPSLTLGRYVVLPAFVAMLILTPLVVAGLVAFLRLSRFGMAMRAAAANPDAARLAGVFSSRMSMLAWAIAGAISAYTAILVFPTQGFITGDTFGPSLLVRAFAAAAIARWNNFAVAFAAGLGLGTLEQALLWNNPSGGFVEMVLFVVILVALLLVPPRGGRGDEKASTWAVVQGFKPLADRLLSLWQVRYLGWMVFAVALAAALLVPVLLHFSTAFALMEIYSFAVVGLSLALITGLNGQLSLGQFALAGIGATAGYYIAIRTGNYVLAVLGGAVGGAAASVLVGLPALRIRGLMLAVTTLALALMSEAWLFQQPWMLGAGVEPGRPSLGTITLVDAKQYYWFALGFLVLAFWLARNVWRGGLGRIFVALRDNEDGARAFTVAATRRKLQAFALAGFLAGMGGAVYAFGLARISYATFPVDLSIDAVAALVLGGVGILAGPLVGAMYIFGIPQFVQLDSAGLAASAAGWLLLVLYVPSGLAGLVRPLRDRLIAWLAPAADADSGDDGAREPSFGAGVKLVTAAAPASGERKRVLTVRGVSKRYGGITAVNGVSLEVLEGETMGLIGPNGAGKTSLFELISGFARPDGGEIIFAGTRLTRSVTLAGRTVARLDATPERRGRLGLVRSFQDAALFPTMTVEEVIMLALERAYPTPLFSSLVGSRESEKPKRERARQLVASMGLETYRRKQVGELSTGTRRIAELACLIALEPRLLLLDEPSSGIAQRESEALGELLLAVKAHLNTTLIVIEHDIPLVMAISDRVVAMESGRIIASGTPEEVRSNARVIESYLGGDLVAIERSGTRASRARVAT